MGTETVLNRRQFFVSVTASAAMPRSWAQLSPAHYLAAARQHDGHFQLAGLDARGHPRFTLALRERGHAAAVHPHHPEAVAIARRPGTRALVLDCLAGHALQTLFCPVGRHFQGHGVFDQAGHRLLTSENDYQAGEGVIGIWDTRDQYRRIDELPSHGIGPHDLRRLPQSDVLVVANGGIETHPHSGQAKLNVATMRPNLSYLDLYGRLLEQVVLPSSLHKASIRHLAIRKDGLVALALQWEGAMDRVIPLLGLHRLGQHEITLLQAPMAVQQHMQGYAGSVAFSRHGERVAVTSPRGGQVQVFDVQKEAFIGALPLIDACGIAPGMEGDFLVTTGEGVLWSLTDMRLNLLQRQNVQWDNHLIVLPQQG